MAPCLLLLGGSLPDEIHRTSLAIKQLLPSGWLFRFTTAPGVSPVQFPAAIGQHFWRTAHPLEWRYLGSALVNQGVQVIIAAAEADFYLAEADQDFTFSSLCRLLDINLVARASLSAPGLWEAAEALTYRSPVDRYPGLDCLTTLPTFTGFQAPAVSLGLSLAHVRAALPAYTSAEARRYLHLRASLFPRGRSAFDGYGSLWAWDNIPPLAALPLSLVPPLNLRAVLREGYVDLRWQDFDITDGGLTEVYTDDGLLIYAGTDTFYSWQPTYSGFVEFAARRIQGTNVSDYTFPVGLSLPQLSGLTGIRARMLTGGQVAVKDSPVVFTPLRLDDYASGSVLMAAITVVSDESGWLSTPGQYRKMTLLPGTYRVNSSLETFDILVPPYAGLCNLNSLKI